MGTRPQLTTRLGVVQAAVEELDLGALGRALWRRKTSILALTLAAAAAAFLAVSLITPRYKSEARVLIETRENVFLRPEAEKTNEPATTTVDQEAVASQVQLILSRDLARDIIDKLKLGERAEFDPVLHGPSLLRTLFGLIGIGRDPMTMTPEERVLKSFQDRLLAYQAEKSRVIVIEFESADPELAATVANAVAAQYLALQRSAKLAQTRAAGQWLAGEIDRLRVKVAEAEAEVERYRSQMGLFVVGNNLTLSSQQLNDYNAQLSAARAQKADAEAKARLIREALRAGAPIDFSDITNSELLRRLSEQRVTLRAQLAEQSSTLLPAHPRIKELRAQIADLEAQIRGEAERLVRTLENDAKLADARMGTFNTGLDQLKQQSSTSNEQDVQLRALERDAKSQRDLLESYLAKYREATARDSIDAASPDARIISTATVSNTPSWPKTLPTVLVATLGMLALTVGFALTSELLAAMPAPGAAFAPRASAPAPTDDGGRGARADSEAAGEIGVPLESIEALGQEIANAGKSGSRVAIVGAARNVGTTVTAITLARSLARTGSVVLVDLALAGRNLSVIASDPLAPGMAELIAGTASYGDIITRDRHSLLHLVMAGRVSDGQALIASLRLSVAIEALARSYDHLVIDAGALPEMAAERFAELAPQAVLIASDVDDLATMEARERLLRAGFTDVEVLASGSDRRAAQAGRAQAAA
ncbi:MAG TPA: exopolysaccharide transport family protein [Xanthobacteraceae bacterium]